MGPVEFLARLQIEALRQPAVAPAIRGQGRDVPVHDAAQQLHDADILRVRAALVPQAQGADHAAFPQRQAACRRLRHIVLQPLAFAVALKGVEGDADLVEGGAVPQKRQLLRQQGAIGGQADPIIQLGADAEDLRQLRVQQRLPHDVEVQILRVGAELFRQQRKVLRRHEALFPCGAGAEGTG